MPWEGVVGSPDEGLLMSLQILVILGLGRYLLNLGRCLVASSSRLSSFPVLVSFSCSTCGSPRQ